MPAVTRARISIEAGPRSGSFSIGSNGHPFLDKSEGGGFITKAHIGQCEIAKERLVFRLLLVSSIYPF
jgi:hypothetical protein